MTLNWTCSQEFRANWILWNTSWCYIQDDIQLDTLRSLGLTGYCGIPHGVTLRMISAQGILSEQDTVIVIVVFYSC